MLHFFTVRARWIYLGIVVLEYAEPSRKKKMNWWDNLVIQYIQELCWLVVHRPDRLKQPQIITLQFADFNQNARPLRSAAAGRLAHPASCTTGSCSSRMRSFKNCSLAAHFPPQPEDSLLHSVPWLLCRCPRNLLSLSPLYFIFYLVS